jgi:putative ABC transport system permease protein
MQGACYGMPMQVASKPLVDRANRAGGFYKIVSPSYFTTLKLQMIRGRPLGDRDMKGTPPVLVINDRLAKREFGDKDPVGERLLVQEIIPGKTELGPEIAWEIVGVVRDEKVNGVIDTQSTGVYVSNEQTPSYFQTLSVRTNVDPLTLQKAVVAAVHSINKDQATTDIRTVDQIKDLSMANRRLQAVLLGIFASVALLLAGIGIYGVISYSVAQRTHEIGIRAALGATEARLMGLILRRGVLLAVIGLVVGVGGSLGLTRLMESLLFGVGARDPFTMTLVAVVLALVAVIACYVPARRATKIDPLLALRI